MGTEMEEYPEFRALFNRMKALANDRLVAWSGTIFRSAPPKWATEANLLSGAGSMRSGARFNAPGTFAAIYGSTSPELAMIESLAYQSRAGLPIEQALPLVFKAVQVQVGRALDLRSGGVLLTLGIKADEVLSEEWWTSRSRRKESLTQALGRAAYLCGIEAILTPSAHSTEHGHNVIVLPDNLGSASTLKVLRRRR